MEYTFSSVFSSATFPEYTYVNRKSSGEFTYEERLKMALEQMGYLIVIDGPSKIGKTVLCEAVIGKEKLVSMTGNDFKGENDLWAVIAKKVDITLRNNACYFLTKYSQIETKERIFMLQIFNYTAGKGDCIRLHYTGKSGVIRNVIIDTGVIRFASRFDAICSEISDVGEQVDVLILTHVDDDHIGGLFSNLRQKRKLPIKEVWMNHGSMISNHVDLSVRQNDEVYTGLIRNNIPVKSAVKGDRYEMDGASFHILWPTKDALAQLSAGQNIIPLGRLSDYGFPIEELMDMPIKRRDTSLSNHASIVFEFEYDKVRFLFTGDAWSEDVVANVERGNYDLVKLPHHGSVRNLSEEWFNKIQCKNFMICTDGIMHPDKQTIAKLLKWYGEINVYGSVPWWNKFMTEKEKYYKVHFVEGEEILWE